MSSNSFFVSKNGLRIFHNQATHKDGQLPLVFVHGMWANGLIFWFWLSLCESFGIKAYSVELPEHGYNHNKKVGKQSVRGNYAMAVSNAITQEIGECILVGWSMGGLISQLVAGMNPLVKKLVLVTSAAPRGIFVGWRTFKKMLNLRYLWAMFLGRPLVLSPEDTRYLMFNVGFDEEEFKGFLGQLIPESGRAAREMSILGVKVSPVTCPVFIIGAQNDNITPISVQKKIRGMFPGSWYLEVPNAAHAIMLQRGARLIAFNAIVGWAYGAVPQGQESFARAA